MPKVTKPPTDESDGTRKLFSVRLLPKTIRRLKDIAHVTDTSTQEIVEDALTRYFREVKLPPDQARRLKALLAD
jgi:predicted transcriptional regulator